jgi:hypothetical protein
VVGYSSPLKAEGALRVIGIELVGATRTNIDWLKDYLDYDFPKVMTSNDTDLVMRKLLTTGVFSTVKASFAPTGEGDYWLRIEVDEKWTAIPIIRGVYGGGTPLTVLGAYDIHTLGRLLTLGGEVRKYGDAPPGFVVYARDPRRASGRYFLGLEFWRDFRRRQLFDREGELLGSIGTNASISRLRYLGPLSSVADANLSFPWKIGFNLEAMEEAPAVFDAENEDSLPPKELVLTTKRIQQIKWLPTLQFDDIEINDLDFDGIRWTTKWGPLFDGEKRHGVGEAEFYWYEFMPFDLNMAAHALVGYSSDDSIQSQYFLGGFDSIRGFPDGIVYGSRAGYLNAELRQTSMKWKYLWLQSVGFVDIGGAGRNWDDAFQNSHSAVGAGIRIAVPQVYRLMLRIDYAWALDGSGAQGITAGLNQFFDPFRPL